MIATGSACGATPGVRLVAWLCACTAWSAFGVGVGGAIEGVRNQKSTALPLARVSAGTYTPLYGGVGNPIQIDVAPFLMMTRPVTNAEFLAFVVATPAFRRDQIARVFADASYLSHWLGATELGLSVLPLQPVTRVSWFAANAYCEGLGLRLPLEAEWELAAAASETRKDASADPKHLRKLLTWYAAPSRNLPEVAQGKPNFYGLRDLHGVVWEWVLDFNNAYVVSDGREQGDAIGDRFCGGGSVLASNPANYAAFMRFAMRGSLQADYTTATLGFRCARDLAKEPR